MKRHAKNLLLFVLIGVFLISAGTVSMKLYDSEKNDGYQYVIGMSQANLNDPWRIAMNEEIAEEAQRYSNIKIVFRDAGGSPEKQESDIGELCGSGINLLIVSMDDSKKLTSIVSKVYKKIPVIILDRAVEGYDYSLYIGNDNRSIGQQVGNLIAKLAGGKKINMLEIQGSLDDETTAERSEGLHQVLKQHVNINLERTLICNWKLDDARSDVSQVLSGEGRKIDLIFADSDYMALGAYQAVHSMNLKPAIIGIDGLGGKNGGLELIRSGVLHATFTCSTGGKEAVDYAVKILDGEDDVPKKIILRSNLVTAQNVSAYSDRKVHGNSPEKLVLGYAQLTSESKWHDAEARSIREAAQKAGVDLVFLESGKTQADQKEMIRQLIRRKVDIIAFSPVVQAGWDDVLKEAKEAEIPVVICDRNVDSGESLWCCSIGSDFAEEARRVGRQIVQYCRDNLKNQKVDVLQILGTQGSSSELDRDAGLREIFSDYPDIRCTDSAFSDFTYSGGKAEMERCLKQYGKKFSIVYAQNDDMALGAIDAIKEYGLKPGKDIMVFGTDGTRQALLAIKKGEMFNTVECSPLLGPQLVFAAEKIRNGETVPLRIINAENLFNRDISFMAILNRKY